MSLLARKLLGVGLAVAVLGVAIGLYVTSWATGLPKALPISASAGAASSSDTQLTMQTVAAVGPKLSPQHPDWVSYLVKSQGKWVRDTIMTARANSVVHVTIYQFDSASGLRNPFLAEAQGTVGGEQVDGKPAAAIDPAEASHSFALPELGVFVPLPGISASAKNPCASAPCDLSSDHRTITFSFRTGRKGRYHWQCFVPCGAGSINGNGGPMQTFAYMHGFLDVV